MQVSLVLAMVFENPVSRRIADISLHPRDAVLSVSSTAIISPPTMLPTPTLRIARLREGFELLTVQWVKFGWAWWRRKSSTVAAASLKADGCVVVDSA